MISLNTVRLSGFSPKLFSFSVSSRPGSVRDTVFHADNLCKQLLEQEEVLPGEQVLVVGYGPAAIASTLALMSKGVKVHIFAPPKDPDEESLDECTTRWICPTTNDFPARDWQGRSFPTSLIPAHESGCGWAASSGEGIDSQLQDNLNFARESKVKGIDYEEFRHGAISDIKPVTDTDAAFTPAIDVEAKLETGAVVFRARFRAVILCIGGGKHTNTFVGSKGTFSGFGWWSDADDCLVNPQKYGRERLCVIGAGDSGLADFVRLLTGDEDPYESLRKLHLAQPFVDRIAAVSKQMWNSASRGQLDHPALLATQNQLIEIADAIFADAEHHRRVKEGLLEREHRPDVQLAVPCYHFGMSYPANRVLVHLLARAARDDGQTIPPFRVAVKPIDIFGLDGHQCQGKAADCSVHRHQVTFVRDATCTRPIEFDDLVDRGLVTDAESLELDEGRFDAYFRVILRHKPRFVMRPFHPAIDPLYEEFRKQSHSDVPPFYFP
jgi:hypothetical protein